MKDWTGDGNSIWKTLGASNHTDEEREQDDFYATDPDAIDKLLTVETPNKKIWECAAGAGHLVRRFLCAKNGEFERMREGGGSAVAYAWFVWEKGYNGITSLGWI